MEKLKLNPLGFCILFVALSHKKTSRQELLVFLFMTEKIVARMWLLGRDGWSIQMEELCLQHLVDANNMKKYDRVELIVEKEKYAKEGVHGTVKEKDLKVIWESTK